MLSFPGIKDSWTCCGGTATVALFGNSQSGRTALFGRLVRDSFGGHFGHPIHDHVYFVRVRGGPDAEVARVLLLEGPRNGTAAGASLLRFGRVSVLAVQPPPRGELSANHTGNTQDPNDVSLGEFLRHLDDHHTAEVRAFADEATRAVAIARSERPPPHICVVLTKTDLLSAAAQSTLRSVLPLRQSDDGSVLSPDAKGDGPVAESDRSRILSSAFFRACVDNGVSVFMASAKTGDGVQSFFECIGRLAARNCGASSSVPLRGGVRLPSRPPALHIPSGS